MGYTTTIRSKRQRIVTALDVGTSKICCLIAKTSPAPDWFEGKGDAMQFEVLGFDHTRAEGLKAGMIAHLDSAEACIRSAVDAAERMAGVTVEDVHVSVTCGRLKSETFSASVALPSGAVREDDVMRLLAGGRQYAGRDKRSVLHALPLSYRIDENGGISEPQGMCGERLAVDLHAVTADEVAMRNVMLCVERCHLGVASLVAAPYASALSVVTPDEAKLGVACIDFGAGTTTLSVFVDGHFIHADAIALGGNGITTDIARTLSRAARLRRAAQDPAWQRLRHAVGRARDHHLSGRHRHAAAEPEPDHQGAARRHHPPAHRGDSRPDAPQACRGWARRRGHPASRADRRRQPAHRPARACRQHVRQARAAWPSALDERPSGRGGCARFLRRDRPLAALGVAATTGCPAGASSASCAPAPAISPRSASGYGTIFDSREGSMGASRGSAGSEPE